MLPGMPMSSRPAVRLAALLALAVPALLTSADLRSAETLPNWPQWRGPSGQGYVDDEGVPLRWGEKENVLWKTTLPGAGNSTPIVWGDRLFLTCSSPDGGERMVLCVPVRDGEGLWKQTASTGAPSRRPHEWNCYA